LDSVAASMRRAKQLKMKREKGKKTLLCAATKYFHRDVFHSVYVAIDTFIRATAARSS
jgi:hypothetical protein